MDLMGSLQQRDERDHRQPAPDCCEADRRVVAHTSCHADSEDLGQNRDHLQWRHQSAPDVTDLPQRTPSLWGLMAGAMCRTLAKAIARARLRSVEAGEKPITMDLR